MDTICLFTQLLNSVGIWITFVIIVKKKQAKPVSHLISDAWLSVENEIFIDKVINIKC